MVPLYPPLRKVVSAAGRGLVQYHLPMQKDLNGTCRYEMDVEVWAARHVETLIFLWPQNGAGLLNGFFLLFVTFQVIRSHRQMFKPQSIRNISKLCKNLLSEELKKVFDKEKIRGLILCSPHNPLSRVWSREELESLAKACKERDILVIVDEVWADWCWKRFLPFQPIAKEAGCKCISLGSPTKTWNLAGLHCSYAIIEDEAMLQRFKDYVEPQFLHHCSIFGAEAMRLAYGSVEWMHAVRDYVNANFIFLKEKLTEIQGIQLAPCLNASKCQTICDLLQSRLNLFLHS